MSNNFFENTIVISTSIFLLLIILLFVSSCNNGKAEAESASTESSSTALSAQAVRAEPVPLSQKLNATGTFLANESVEITTEFAGTIRNISFCEGCRVKEGEVLVRFDQRDVNSEIEKLNVDIQLAQNELKRARRLDSIRAISQEELQQKSNRLQSLEAQRKVLRVRASKMSIRAPFNGKTGLRNVSEGSYLQPGTLITTLKQINPIKLEFGVPEEYAHTFSEGDTVMFTSSQSTKHHPAVIYASETGINTTTRSRSFRAKAENSEELFLPGGYADVSYQPSREKKALLIPAEAIVQELAGQVIYKVRNGEAHKQPVEIGTRTRNAVEIKEGIVRGDTVMITGLLNVSDGQPVDVSLKNIAENE